VLGSPPNNFDILKHFLVIFSLGSQLYYLSYLRFGIIKPATGELTFYPFINGGGQRGNPNLGGPIGPIGPIGPGPIPICGGGGI